MAELAPASKNVNVTNISYETENELMNLKMLAPQTHIMSTGTRPILLMNIWKKNYKISISRRDFLPVR